MKKKKVKKFFYVKERFNPQLGTYFVYEGKLSIKEAKKYEKPLYGSKGIGITRLDDRAFAENVIYSLSQLNHVFYLQEFVEHQNRDIRILVLGDRAITPARRVHGMGPCGTALASRSSRTSAPRCGPRVSAGSSPRSCGSAPSKAMCTTLVRTW